jgi:hypothetical protein
MYEVHAFYGGFESLPVRSFATPWVAIPGSGKRVKKGPTAREIAREPA